MSTPSGAAERVRDEHGDMLTLTQALLAQALLAPAPRTGLVQAE